MKKNDLAKKLIRNNSNLFMCPLCRHRMTINDLGSLTCKNKHCFDLSKNGYVNMLLNKVKTEYDKKMLESRNIICKNGFFNPMIQEVSELIIKNTLKRNSKKSSILDAGCGEGSHLSSILMNLRNDTNIYHQGVGIDISKEGIHIAARDYTDIIWCVADLSKMPFRHKQFDIVLSILSPSNYSEFNRVLNDDGIVIKVVPGSEYLTELRSIFHEKTDKQTYSNDRVIKHFANNFNMIEKKHISYTFTLDNENFDDLIKMTPLSWSVDNEKIEKAKKLRIKNITVDFCIIVGEKSKEVAKAVV